MGEVRVGISGWTYAGWRGDFYPKGLPHRRELAYAAERLGTIEINEHGARLRHQGPNGRHEFTVDDEGFVLDVAHLSYRLR